MYFAGEPTYVCPELAGGGGAVDPDAKLIDLVQFLAAMEHALADEASIDGIDGTLNIAEPYYLTSQPQMESSSEVFIYQDVTLLATGFTTVVADHTTGDVDLVVELTEAGVTRTLGQLVSLADGVLTTWGTMTIGDGANPATVLAGGWIYSVAEGLALHPDADAGFVDAAAAMLHVPDVGGRGFLANIVSLIVDFVAVPVSYILDIFVPYVPPVACLGPVVYDGSGQTCADDRVVCKDDLPEMCQHIDSIPEVSVAFKKCMKGRCGCGGSWHQRARVSCGNSTTCGGCPSGSGGCGSWGSRVWYCRDETATNCSCVLTIFHEMAHACWALDDPDCTASFACPAPDWQGQSGACRVGTWLQGQCCDGA